VIFFASCRRHCVLIVTCLDACRCAAYLRGLQQGLLEIYLSVYFFSLFPVRSLILNSFFSALFLPVLDSSLLSTYPLHLLRSSALSYVLLFSLTLVLLSCLVPSCCTIPSRYILPFLFRFCFLPHVPPAYLRFFLPLWSLLPLLYSFVLFDVLSFIFFLSFLLQSRPRNQLRYLRFPWFLQADVGRVPLIMSQPFSSIIFMWDSSLLINLRTLYRPSRSRDSVVGIATAYGLDDRGVGVLVPVG
jgi:hypothetical protein